MVGGGLRKDDGAVGIDTTNVFAALETLKKRKKSSDKDCNGLSKRQGSSKAHAREPEPPQVTWVPTPLNKSWADVDDDDDDYFESAPVLPGWASAQTQDKKDVMAHSVDEDSESEDGLIEGDYDVEDEPEQDPEPSAPDEPISKNPAPTPVALKDPERQLSKKELKKKELEELEALLAEFKVSKKEEKNTVPVENNAAADENGKENTSTQINIKTSKKKKVKKEKSSNEGKDAQKSTNDPNASGGAAGAELKEDSVSSEVDIKEKLKKIASKKKKSTKDTEAPSKAAAVEAAARSAKLAAVKKKEKSHYNQQPVR